MQLLPIDMPPSARIIWVSEAAKDKWMVPIAEACAAYSVMEQRTVAEGIRRCMTSHVTPDRIEQQIRGFAKVGLTFVPIQKVGTYQGFAHRHPPVVEGQPWSYYGIVAKRVEDAEAFVDATERGDHITMGDLLGYPECCTRFFQNVWMRGYVDPIWQAAENTESSVAAEVQRPSGGTFETITREIKMNPAMWTGLRYIGLRIAPHLVCSFDCAPSIEIAKDWTALSQRTRPVDGLDDLLRLLDMPCEWSCLKGIAMVSTPIFRIVTNSVPCWPRYVVRKDGNFLPAEGARGLIYPFRLSLKAVQNVAASK